MRPIENHSCHPDIAATSQENVGHTRSCGNHSSGLVNHLALRAASLTVIEVEESWREPERARDGGDPLAGFPRNGAAPPDPDTPAMLPVKRPS